jgi:carbon-monoxide dehydrogenase large subunit
MSATGIGAAVRRKEDQRFVTGKGHYTDDVNRAGQCYAYFLRSPHAHARINGIDSKAAAAMPGVLAVLTAAELTADKIGNLICGWMITSKDGSQMKMAPHPAIAHGKANYVGDAVAVVVAQTLAQAKDAAEKIKVDYQVLPAVADPAKVQGQGAPQIHEVAAHNTIYQWHLGDAKAVEAAVAAAKHVTKLDLINNRLVPNAIEPRAAIGEYDAGTDSLTLWNTTQNPHVARLVMSAFIGLAPEHKLRVIAPDVGGGFGSKIFIYPEEVVCLWAARKVGRRTRRWRSMPMARSPRCASRPSPISAPICRRSRPRCRPISTARCSPGSMKSRRSIARWMRSIPIPCRSTPIAAPAARKRRSWSSG